jgi:hypothetical protein
VARDFDPVPGQWYKDLDAAEVFQVLTVNPDEEILEVQYENGDIEELDLDTWHELDLDQTEQPEGWAGSEDEEEEEDLEEEDEDDDEDDWDDDEDEDWDEDDDEYDDRN